MSKTIGYVDEEGIFSLLATFNPQNPDELEKMFRLLSDDEMNAAVRDYGPDQVEVIYRPDHLGGYGF